MELSEYCKTLSATDRAVYLDKIRNANVSGDPYALQKSEFNGDYESYPPVTYPDICDYLISSPNPEYNFQSMKCHKSLKAHNFFTSGWVKEVVVSQTSRQPSTSAASGHPVIVRGRVSIYPNIPV